jgi:hypothetical protein
MKEDNPKENEQLTPVVTSEKQVKQVSTQKEIEQDKETLIGFLIKQSDALAEEALRKKKARDDEKIRFINGMQISLNEIRNIIVATALPYSPMFPNDVDFYKEIYRLYGWDDKDPNEYIKPACVAKLTNAIIYGRFSKDVLPTLQVLNGVLPNSWIRGYKHFQFLNTEGQKQLIEFRDEAIKVMKICKNMHEFRIKYAQMYGVPYNYQQNLFETN